MRQKNMPSGRRLSMSIYHVLGFLFAILSVVIVIAVLKKKKLTKSYDERQIASRGKAFRAGFVAFLVCESGLFIAETLLEKEIDIFSPGVLHLLVVIVAAIVFVVVSIFRDAYFPVGQKVSRRYFFSLGMIIVLWTLLLLKGKWIDENGKLGMNVLLLAMIVLAVSILVSVIIRNLMIKSESEKDVD